MGPDLPLYNNASIDYPLPGLPCTVQLNSTHTMITGGSLNDVTISDVWLLDWNLKQWSQGPSLLKARRNHKCISLSAGRVMVAGGDGHNYEDVSQGVEIFDSGLDGWYSSAEMPEPVHYLLAWGLAPVMINYDGDIWKQTDEVWTKLNIRTTNNIPAFAFGNTLPNSFMSNCDQEKKVLHSNNL